MDMQTETIQKLTKGLEQGGRKISKIVLGLVEKNQLAQTQLPSIFYSATKSASSLKDKIDPIRRELENIEREEAKGGLDEDMAIVKQNLLEDYTPLERERRSMHMLASITANKLSTFYSGFIGDTVEDVVGALKDPSNTSVEEFKMLSRNLMVLIGQDMIKKDNTFVDIAEALLDGLEKTKDPKKRNEILYLGEVVLGRLPHQLSRIYSNVLNLTLTSPDNKSGIWRSKVTLQAELNRLKKGESNIRPIVAARMEISLLSDGDMSLPRPKIARTRPAKPVPASVMRLAQTRN